MRQQGVRHSALGFAYSPRRHHPVQGVHNGCAHEGSMR